MNWLRRLFAIASKEIRQLVRDRVTFGLIIGVPVMQILLFGYAINFDVRGVGAVVEPVDGERGADVHRLFEMAAEPRQLGLDVLAQGRGDFDLLAVCVDAHRSLLLSAGCLATAWPGSAAPL